MQAPCRAREAVRAAATANQFAPDSSAASVVSGRDANPGRWLILVVICAAALVIVLDTTVMNLALPSAQRALGFTNAGRQWIVTAYSLSFGGLLLFCGRLADLIGRKATWPAACTASQHPSSASSR